MSVHGIETDALSNYQLSNVPDAMVHDVSKAAAGDQDAFERFVDVHKSLVCSIALAIVRDLEASEEIAQDVFVAAWRQLSKLRNPASYLPWLRQITRNRSHDFLRRRISSRARLQSLVEDSKLSNSVAAEDPRRVLISAQEQEIVREALEQLPDETREIVTLFYREEQSIRQVALLLELSEDTVKKRLSRARQRLRTDVESRLSRTLERSGPTAAFTAAVITGLTFAAPLGAAAATISAATKAAPVVSGGVAAGIIGGFVCGAAAIWGGKRRQLRQAWDDEERRGLRIAAVAEICVMLGFLGFIALWPVWSKTPLKDHPAVALSLIAAYWLGLNICVLWWERKVTRRRLEIQKVEEPETWHAEQRRMAWGLIVSVSVLVLMMVGFGGALYFRTH